MTPLSVALTGPRRRYPHLLKEDAALWVRYLEKHQGEYSHFDYDVRVGLGRDPGENYEENMRKMALDLSMRRIDAVGYKPTEIVIIEVTRSAGIISLGQLAAYPILYSQTYFPNVPIRVMLVAEEIQSDILPVIQVLGYRYELV